MVYDESGTVVDRMDYFPYGEFLGSRNLTGISQDETKFHFTGKERDFETGYDYFGWRTYNNRLGIWNSTDPMSAMRPGLSLFNYCQNNPVNRIDPNGRIDGGVFSIPILVTAAKILTDALLSVAATALVYDAVTGGENFGARLISPDQAGSFNNTSVSPDQSGSFNNNTSFPDLGGTLGQNTTVVPSDATGVKLGTEVKIDQGANSVIRLDSRKNDLNQVDYITKKYGIDRKEFSTYLHNVKKGTDMKGKSVSKEYLEELAKEFKEFSEEKNDE